MEAMVKAITLPEDFTDFESQLPDLKYNVLHPSHRQGVSWVEFLTTVLLTATVKGFCCGCVSFPVLLMWSITSH